MSWWGCFYMDVIVFSFSFSYCYCCCCFYYFFFFFIRLSSQIFEKKRIEKARKESDAVRWKKRKKRWERKNVIPEHAQRRFESSGLAALYLFCVRTKVRCYLFLLMLLFYFWSQEEEGEEKKKKKNERNDEVGNKYYRGWFSVFRAPMMKWSEVSDRCRLMFIRGLVLQLNNWILWLFLSVREKKQIPCQRLYCFAFSCRLRTELTNISTKRNIHPNKDLSDIFFLSFFLSFDFLFNQYIFMCVKLTDDVIYS